MTIEQAHQGGIASAHAAYEKLTGNQCQLTTHRIWCWEKFLVGRKFTSADMETVVKYLHGEVAANRAYLPQLRLYNLIDPDQLDRFEAYLNEARAKKRNAAPVKTNRDAVLEGSGRPRVRKSEINVISMNERVKWHLEEMRKAVSFKEKDDARKAAISKLFDGQKPYTQKQENENKTKS